MKKKNTDEENLWLFERLTICLPTEDWRRKFISNDICFCKLMESANWLRGIDFYMYEFLSGNCYF